MISYKENPDCGLSVCVCVCLHACVCVYKLIGISMYIELLKS